MTRSNIQVITVAGSTITITPSASSVEPTGGSVTITGTTTLPDTTPITVVASESVSGYSDTASTQVSGGGSFSVVFTLPSNPYGTTLNYQFQAVSSTGVSSNIVTVTQGPESKDISLHASTTDLSSSGGSVTFDGTVIGYNPGQILYVFVNNTQVTTTTVSEHFSFTFSLSFPADTSSTDDQYAVDVSDNTSNT